MVLNRRRALLLLVVLLALADLVGVEVVHEAWSARREKVADPDRQAVRVQPVNVSSGSEHLVALHRKVTGSSQPVGPVH